MIRDKMGPKGAVFATVISLDKIGQRELEALREVYPLRRKDPDPERAREYERRRNLIYEAHGFRKRRVSWNWKLAIAGWQCLVRGKWDRLQDLFRYEMSVNHNIVTDEGDALIADILANTPARTKVDGTNGYIVVGTGWTGTTPKQNTGVNTQTGSPELMDATYPKLKGAFGAANDNVTQYRSTFEAGDLNDTGIDEAALINNATPASADCLAYGQITPSVNVSTSDVLQMDWELTFVGA